MSPSKILFFLCLSFIAGIALESFIKIPQIFVWGFFILGVLLILSFIFLDKNKFVVLGFCLLFLALGILRFQISEFNIANDKLAKLNNNGLVVVLTGVISDEPDVRDTSQKLNVKIGSSTILVTTSRYPEYEYLDKINLTGKLEAPEVTDTFNYKNYLMKDGIYSVMGFPKIEALSHLAPRSLNEAGYGKVLFLKQKLAESISQISLPPHRFILEGIILGNNKNMTPVLRDQLSNTGLRFLTAISGVHVVIVSAILAGLLMFFGLRRNYAGLLSLFFVWLYIALTGFTASGIRAGIMGSIFIISGALGRQNTSSRIIVLAASIMLLQNPLLLIYDIGFQLSFMASLGIIYLKPLISYLMKFLFKGSMYELSDIISVTFTAQIFTLPLMIFNFGSIPLMSPVTNILILPVMPAILASGFLFSLVGIVSNLLGQILYIPCWILISYFLKVMEIFSAPWMSKTVTNVSWILLFAFYIAIGFFTWFFNKKHSQDFL
jgi:competence protein ComEC